VSRYLLIRVAEALFAIFGVVTIVFFITRLGGDPAVLLLPIGTPDDQIEAFRHAMGFDRPLAAQYLTFLAQALRGDFGESYQHDQPAMLVVIERMPATIELALAAIVLGVIFGAIAGFIAAAKRGTLSELVIMTFALLGQATPVFWLGIMLILLFSVNLGLLPTGGRGEWSNLVLPAVTLATFASASIARLLRSSMIEVLQEDYVRTAWAKGLVPRLVYVRHAARNALIPVVTMIAIISGELLGGAVITETIFSWPGVGRAIVQAIEVKDFPVVQAGVTVIACIFVTINLLVDLLYGAIDPRIRVQR